MKVLRSVFICMFIVVSTLYVWNYLELRESRSESEGLSSQNTQLFKNLDDQENMLANQIQETERIHVQLELVTRELNNNISQNKALISKLGVFSDQLDYQVAETVDLTEEFETVKIELTDIRKILEDKIDENTILTHNLKKTNAELAGKIDKNITLTSDLNATTNQLTIKTNENQELLTALKGTRQELFEVFDELTVKTTENIFLKRDLKEINDRLSSKIYENENLVQNLLITTDELDKIKIENEELQTVAGQVVVLESERDELIQKKSDLDGKIKSLQSEIIQLLDKRAPLILETHTRGFKCTGSMEPKITCLDTATWLENFEPRHVTLGTVISFRVPAGCRLTESSNVAHRVIDMKLQDGTHFYWTKGDANTTDDNCWIRDTDVNAYLIELHKNTALRNTFLREKVNSSKVARVDAWTNYLSSANNYQAKYLEYCGDSSGNVGVCVLQDPLFSQLQAMRIEMDRLYILYTQTYDTWLEWYSQAL